MNLDVRNGNKINSNFIVFNVVSNLTVIYVISGT